MGPVSYAAFSRKAKRDSIPPATPATRPAAGDAETDRTMTAPPPDNSDPFVAAVGEFLDARNLLAPGEGVVVAVSGGADSVALLAALRELARLPGCRRALTAAHLDHGLRASSAGDAAFVAALCRRWGLPCVCEARDVAADAAERSVGIEQAARDARYAFLARVAGERGASAVATAHHADDQVETVLHRLLRGTHLRGLAGIPPRRALGEGVDVVRPLLGVRRAEIEAFCRRRQLPWRTDETNADPAMMRNRLRHELLPWLREHVNPDVDAALLRLADAAAEADAVLADRADALLDDAGFRADGPRAVMDAACLAAADGAVRAAAMRRALERLGARLGRVTAAHLREMAALAEPGGGAVCLPDGLRAARRRRCVVIEPNPAGRGRRARAGRAGPTR